MGSFLSLFNKPLTHDQLRHKIGGESPIRDSVYNIIRCWDIENDKSLPKKGKISDFVIWMASPDIIGYDRYKKINSLEQLNEDERRRLDVLITEWSGKMKEKMKFTDMYLGRKENIDVDVSIVRDDLIKGWEITVKLDW